MNNIGLGTIGFLIIHVSDYISLKRISLLKPIVWLLGGGILAYSIFQLCFTTAKFSVPWWLIGLGWVLLILSLCALLYALFINLPFNKTYVKRGVGDKLIKTGFYALVRHPGVPAFSIMMISLLLVSGSQQLVTAVPIYILLDIVLVILQDKFYFPRMFPGYGSYQQETPMLVPNRQSIRAFIQSVRRSATDN